MPRQVDVVAVVLQQRAQELPRIVVVVDEQDGIGHDLPALRRKARGHNVGRRHTCFRSVSP